MADSQGRQNAKEYKLYVGTGAPLDENDPSDAAYTLVGLLTNNPFDGTSEELRAADKATSGFSSALPGTASYTVGVEAHRKNTGDAGQLIVRDAWVNQTDSIYWLISTANSGDACVSGQASVTAYSEDNSNDEFASMAATLSGQGAPVFATTT